MGEAAAGVAASDIGLGAGAVIGSGVIGYLGHKLISGLTYPFPSHDILFRVLYTFR